MPTPGPAPRGPGRVDRARRPRGQGGGRGLGREVGSARICGDQAFRPLQPPPRLTRMAPGRRRPQPGLRRWGLRRAWERDQGPRPLPGRIPSPSEHPRPGGCVANQPRRLAVWGRPGDSNLQEEKEHGSRWFVFTRWLKAFSSARRLSFFATFSGKASEVGKRRAGHLKAKVSPQKLFPKLALQRRLEYPGRERCKLPPGPGGGAGACAPWLGARAAGTAAPRALRARCALGPARQTGGRGASRSVRLPARSPFWASSAGCELRLLPLAMRLEGGLFFPFFARVSVCARAKSLYLGNERWALAARGEPSGRQWGRLAAPGGVWRRSCHPFSCFGLL